MSVIRARSPPGTLSYTSWKAVPLNGSTQDGQKKLKYYDLNCGVPQNGISQLGRITRPRLAIRKNPQKSGIIWGQILGQIRGNNSTRVIFAGKLSIKKAESNYWAGIRGSCKHDFELLLSSFDLT